LRRDVRDAPGGDRVGAGAPIVSEPERFAIGAAVSASDGDCGKLVRVVVDPVRRALTHIVVGPHDGVLDRLVPVELVDSVDERIHLRCTKAEFDGLDPAIEDHFMPAPPGDWGYHGFDLVSLPYFGLIGYGGVVGPVADPTAGIRPPGPRIVTRDRVPAGEVEIRRGDRVHATDGEIGRVRGLVIDPADHHVTHVLLDEGHLWAHKTVAIPIGAVESVDDGVRVALSTDAVRDLPPVDVDLPPRQEAGGAT
jgi:hypothetical protein